MGVITAPINKAITIIKWVNIHKVQNINKSAQ